MVVATSKTRNRKTMNKEQQKQLIIEIMELDAKDGLYEISDKQIQKAGEEWCHAVGKDGFVNSGDDYDIHELPAFIAGAKWYREQLKQIK
jgi:hypothetical protein